LQKDIKHAWNAFEQKREHLYKKAEEKAEKALNKARSEAEEIVDLLREMQNNSGVKEHELIEARKMFDDLEPHLSSNEPYAPTSSETIESSNLQVGDDVKLLTLDQDGTVAEKLSEDEFLIQIGAMKVKAKGNNLQLAKQKPNEKTTQITTEKA